MDNAHRLKFAIIFVLTIIGFVFRVSGWECGDKVFAIAYTLVLRFVDGV